MCFLFSVLTSIPYAVALSASPLVRSWSSPLLLPMRSMSEANRRLHIVGLSPMEMDVWWSWSVSCMIFSWNKLNRMGDSKHPRLTPTVVLKNSSIWLFKSTALMEFSYSAWMAGTSPSSCWSLWGPVTGLHVRHSQTPYIEVYEAAEQATVVLQVLLYDDSTVDYCASAWSKTCLLFCQQFLSLGLESVEDNPEHHLAGMAD